MTRVAPARPAAMMLTAADIAELLSCSIRHVYRLESDGLMPRAARLRASVRWPRRAIEKWIEDGCPAPSVPETVPADAESL